MGGGLGHPDSSKGNERFCAWQSLLKVKCCIGNNTRLVVMLEYSKTYILARAINFNMPNIIIYDTQEMALTTSIGSVANSYYIMH